MQTKEELEKWHENEDAWGYKTNPDDIQRKRAILETLSPRHFVRALDIGAGEGWITKDLPADTIEAIELSDNAASRFPKNVSRVTEPSGKYDLVVATGVLYKQYDWRTMLDWIKNHAEKYVLLSHIKEWEIPELQELGSPVYTCRFSYRGYTQNIRLYNVSRPQHRR